MAYTLTDRWKYYTEIGTTDSRVANIQINATGTNYINTTAFALFPATPIAGSYIQFAFTRRWWGLKFDIGVAFAATSVDFIWEYSITNTTTWTALRTDNPNIFLTTGVQYINFTPPPDWFTQREVGYKIRCRIVSITGFSANATQQTDRVRFNLKSIVVTGTENYTLHTTAITNNNAGTYNVLPASTSATGLIPIQASVYAIRDISKFDCILAGTSAGAGDTVDVAGTDIDGNAIGETIDVSGGNATYTTTLAYGDVTQIDCNGFTDGTITVNQKKWGMIEQCAPNTYVINCHVQFGDGSTATAVTWYDYFITFMPGAFDYKLTPATFTAGSIVYSGTPAENYERGIAVQYGTYDLQNTGIATDWRSEEQGTGSYSLNGSHVHYMIGAYSGPFYRNSTGGWVFNNSRFIRRYTGSSNFFYSAAPRTFKNCDVLVDLQQFGGTLSISDGTILQALSSQISSTSATITDVAIGGNLNTWFYSGNGIQTAVNCPGVTTQKVTLGYAGAGLGNEKWRINSTLDLMVIDENDNPFEDVTVTVVDGVGATQVNTTTDADGLIVQQPLVAQSGSFTAGAPAIVWVDKSSVVLTCSATGYASIALPLELKGSGDPTIPANWCVAQSFKIKMALACVPAETIMLESGDLAKRIADSPFDGFYIDL